MIDLNNIDKIIICTFPKVGCSTLLKTFKNRRFRIKFKKTKYDVIGIHKIHKLKQYLSAFKNQNVLIINSCRNLFDQKISHFFEFLSKYDDLLLKSICKNYNLPLKDMYKNDDLILYLINYFNKNYLNYSDVENCTDHLISQETEWQQRFSNVKNFYNNFNEYNIKLKKFNFIDKYNLYVENNITMLTIRFEDINEWNIILSKIFNTEIKLLNDYLTKDKEIYYLYTKFKNTYKYNEEQINEIKDINFMKLFYEDEFILDKINSLSF